jgi:hypothetical protein
MRGFRPSKTFRQAASCLLFFLIAVASPIAAQGKRFRPQPQYLQFGEPDQAEGRRLIEDFRERGLAGEYYLEFSLRVMPRRGAERLVPGRLWGGRNERGPIARLALSPGVAAAERRLLIQNGPQSAVWSWPASGATDAPALAGNAAARLETATPGSAALFEPLAETDLTAFDLQMPFLYWNDFVFEGVANLRGRPAHAFLFYPTAEIAKLRPELAGVRVYLDTAYHALVQSEHIGAESRVLRTLTLLEFKKIDDQWIVKAIDLRDETTRNKTRFLVTGAALGLELPAKIFEPAALAETVRPPPADRVRPVGR